MRIAVPYEKGEIFQHFGHTEEFMIYDIKNSEIVSQQVVSAGGFGHGALADFLKGLKADILICGGIGQGAIMALEEAGIKVCGGVSGAADEAVKSYLSGNLVFSAEANCDHHGDHRHDYHHGHGHYGGHNGCRGNGGGCHE